MRAKFSQWQDRKYQGKRDLQELPSWKQAIADIDKFQRGGEGDALQHHQTTKPENDEGKPSFMKAKYGDSIAKAEKKMNDLRKSKRQANLAGRRT